MSSIEVRPGPKNTRQVITAAGQTLNIPQNWGLLPPGDPALSRRIKNDGPSFTMIELKGRKKFSHGIWAPKDRIDALRAELITERDEPAYQKKLDAGRARSARKSRMRSTTDFSRCPAARISKSRNSDYDKHKPTRRNLGLPCGCGARGRRRRGRR